ncbi:MAG: exodeoxyribonuclease VII large subunit [Phycisphaerales bacterium]
MARRFFDPKKARGGDPDAGGQFDLFAASAEPAREGSESAAPIGEPPPTSAEPPSERRREEPPPLSVTELSELIGGALSTLPSRLRVVGEVSNLSHNRHLYFSLKDEEAVIPCVMWASQLRELSAIPRNGDSVEIRGQVGHFAKYGKTQIYVHRITPVGLGSLEARLREMCEALRALGYFDPARKKPLPAFPRRIALVTGANSAALADCLRTARERMPAVDVLVVPVKVQGVGAAEEVARAIGLLDRAAANLGIDAICVTRGGGSLEDLWAFNERVVADAVFACRTPLVAAIGHESDTSVIELVADVRESTPSLAMTRLLPSRRELAAQLAKDAQRLATALRTRAAEERARFRLSAQHEFLRKPGARLLREATRLADLRRLLARSLEARLRLARREQEGRAARLRQALREAVPDRREMESLGRRLRIASETRLRLAQGRVGGAAARLRAVGPASVLERGFAIVVDSEGRLVRSVAAVGPGSSLKVAVADGVLETKVAERAAGDPFEQLARGKR